ncbi:MAG: porin [Pseudomonadales bacterium]|nr:porin [Pseudomonadales bacterium]
MKSNNVTWRVFLACLVVSAGVNVPVFSEIRYNGFLSAGAGALIDDDEVAIYDGFDGDWNTNPDTTFGLQITAEITDKVSATGQFVATGDNNYNVEADWAYVSYSINDSWDVRVGRLRAPFFIYSDFLEVGYAYPWIRPPEQVYRFLFSTVEGVDAIYTSTVGGWDSTLQAYFGALHDETSLGGGVSEINLKDFMGINWTLANDWLTVRATYNLANASIGAPAAIQPLFDSLNALGFGSVSEALAIDNEDASFAGIGISIDRDNWLLNAEYTDVNFDDQALTGDNTAWYVMLGRRMGNITVHATYSKQKSHEDLDFIDVIPAGVDPGLDGLRAVVAGAIASEDNKVIALGMRYDFTDSTAFKVELADLDLSGADGMLLSFSVDVVF